MANTSDLFGGYSFLMALAEVVFDAIIAAKHHTGHQAQHFFGADRQGTVCIGIGVQVEQAVDDLLFLPRMTSFMRAR